MSYDKKKKRSLADCKKKEELRVYYIIRFLVAIAIDIIILSYGLGDMRSLDGRQSFCRVGGGAETDANSKNYTAADTLLCYNAIRINYALTFIAAYTRARADVGYKYVVIDAPSSCMRPVQKRQ